MTKCGAEHLNNRCSCGWCSAAIKLCVVKGLWHPRSSSQCCSVYTDEDSFTAKNLSAVWVTMFYPNRKVANQFLSSVINQTLMPAKSGVKAFIHAVVGNSIHVCS